MKGILVFTNDGKLEPKSKKREKGRKNILKKIVNTGDTELKKVFKYEDADILVLSDLNGKIWYKAKDIATILEYGNTRDAILTHVGDKYKKAYSEVVGNSDVNVKIDPKTLFITDSGLWQLISRSKKPEAEKLWEYITEEVLPKLFSKGTYSLPAKQSDIDSLNKNFYDENMISKYYNKHVVYLAYVGEYSKKHYLKFGISHNFVQRDLEQHRKSFKIFNVIKIWETLAKEKVEESIKHNFMSKGMLTSMKKKEMHIKCKDNGKDPSIHELIVLNEVNGVDYCTKTIDDLVATTKIPQELIYIDRIKEIENNHKINTLQQELKSKTEQINMYDKLFESMNRRISILEDNLQSKDYIETGLKTGNYLGKTVY